jgi:hypothetical protein
MKTPNYLALIAFSFTVAFTSNIDGQNVNMQWVQRYNYCPTCVQDLNEAQSIGIDRNENVYVGGYSQQVDNDMNWAVVKYSSAGSFLWKLGMEGQQAASMHCMI